VNPAALRPVSFGPIFAIGRFRNICAIRISDRIIDFRQIHGHVRRLACLSCEQVEEQ
jgi:hypothetical protein